MKIIFATRPSALARWQTNWVRQELQKSWPALETRAQVITTSGDRILDRPLPEIGGKGLFTQELEAVLLSGEVDAAVHSLKDLPVASPPGLAVTAIPTRAEVRDALVSAAGYTLDSLPAGARVGTSSLRRSAQLLAYRPDLQPEPLRGNVDGRIRKALQGQYDAILLAGAGLVRLGLTEHVSQWLPLELMLPAPGQGALAVQSRASADQTRQVISSIDDALTRQAVTAERAFLNGLGGGCAVPVAAFAIASGGQIQLTGLVASPNGQQVIRVAAEGTAPEELGSRLAGLAISQGAQQILAEPRFPSSP